MLAIQDKVINRSRIRKLLLAPEILEQLNEVGNRLAKTSETLKLFGAVCALNVEHGYNIARICDELKSNPSCSSSPAVRLEEFCQLKIFERAGSDIAQQTKV